MNRKQILEKQKALGSISQSKTGDAILRKNIFEMRVLKTKLSELENEEKMWKNHHKYDVKEARKEARSREMEKVMTFRRVAQVALATQRLKKLGPLFDQSPRPTEVIKEVVEDIEVNTHEDEKSVTKKLRVPSNFECTSRLPPLSPRQTRLLSSHFPEGSNTFSSPILVRKRFNTWTDGQKNRIISADSSTAARDITQSTGPQASTMSPMLDRRFLGLKAALVPMHPSEESDEEERQKDDDDDDSSDDEIIGFQSSILL